jgi:flagellar protein FlaG
MSSVELSYARIDATAPSMRQASQLSSKGVNSAKAIEHIKSTVQASAAALAVNKTHSETKVTNQKAIESAVKDINQVFQSSNTSLAFYVDKSSQRFVVEVKDTDTGESIVKFPGEAVLKIAESIETLKGVLFDKAL